MKDTAVKAVVRTEEVNLVARAGACRSLTRTVKSCPVGIMILPVAEVRDEVLPNLPAQAVSDCRH